MTIATENPPPEKPEESEPAENGKVMRAAGVVGAATFLSRIFGFLRDMVVAAYFGAGMVTDAFFVSFRIPNLLRRLLAEGSLTVAFVPVFTDYLQNKSKRDALELANVVFTALSIVLVLVSLTGVLLSPVIVAIMAPGFIKEPAQYDLAVFLTRLMFPYIFFISLVALCMGILNSLRHFAAPAFSPVLLNLAMIAATMLLKDLFTEPIYALAVGVMIGGALQLALQWPFLWRLGVKLRADFNFRHPGLKRIGLLMLPALFGGAVYQINILVGTILASLLPSGSVSYLYYADRLVELPLGVFGIAVGTAALPSFSRLVSRGEAEEFKETIAFSLRLILFVTIPASLALLVLGEPIISVLFQRGAFVLNDTLRTNEALIAYTLGLWAFSAIRIVVSAFHALQDMRTPMRAAVAALLVNVILSLILMFPLKHAGLALATSIASAVNVIMLYVILRRRIGVFLKRDFFRSCGKIMTSSLAMWGVIFLLGLFFPWKPQGDALERIAFLCLAIAGGLGGFLLMAYFLKCEELKSLMTLAGRRKPTKR
ncbi:MAG: murein biosynthesis integral membrane protein MurJ [Smithellaceae bacterium]|nr:murein biosynthesis integral membrane protein MurJ [Smithellaceae bacterium]